MTIQSLHSSPPAETRLGRLWDYVREMFPLRVRVPLNLLNFAFIYVGLQALHGVSPLRFSWIAVIGAFTVQLLWFFIRVFDELKDAESDIALARAGDPRFQNRPIVTGKVTLADISALRWWMVATVLVLNIPFGFPALAVGIAVAMGYLTLTYKWLFWPPIRHHVLLVFVTHAPNALVIQIYTAAVYVAEFGMPQTAPATLLLLALWATVAAFEFAYRPRLHAGDDPPRGPARLERLGDGRGGCVGPGRLHRIPAPSGHAARHPHALHRHLLVCELQSSHRCRVRAAARGVRGLTRGL